MVGVTLSTLVVPATGVFIASSISGFILDYLNQKGKLTILSYNKYTRDARAIHKAITKEIVKLDKIIRENKNPKVTEKAKKEKYELEKILKSYKEYKSQEEYYAAHGYKAENIEYAKSDIKDFIEAYKNKSFIYSNGTNAIGLYYTGVTQQEYEKFVTKYLKDGYNKYENDAGNDIQIDINDTYTYQAIINEAKESVNKSYKEYIQADAELGYYRLSEPPKGVERKEF